MMNIVKAEDEKVLHRLGEFEQGVSAKYNSLYDQFSAMSDEELKEIAEAFVFAISTICVERDREWTELFSGLGIQSQKIDFE